MLRFVNSDLKSVVLKEVGNILFALFFIHSKETQKSFKPNGITTRQKKETFK